MTSFGNLYIASLTVSHGYTGCSRWSRRSSMIAFSRNDIYLCVAAVGILSSCYKFLLCMKYIYLFIYNITIIHNVCSYLECYLVSLKVGGINVNTPYIEPSCKGYFESALTVLLLWRELLLVWARRGLKLSTRDTLWVCKVSDWPGVLVWHRSQTAAKWL